jgi:ABC-2 type transport system ATP-binding protein
MEHTRIRQRAEHLLALLGLGEVSARKVRHFSRGMLQRLGLAQALIHEPGLLVLDEPMGGLDPFGRQLVRDIIADSKAQGKTLLYSSHILADAELVADRVAIISGGKLLKLATLEELRGPGRSGLEVTVAPSEQLSLERLQEYWPAGRISGNVWVFPIVEDELQRGLAEAIERGARIINVQAQQAPLENTLLAIMEEHREEEDQT